MNRQPAVPEEPSMLPWRRMTAGPRLTGGDVVGAGAVRQLHPAAQQAGDVNDAFFREPAALGVLREFSTHN